MVERIKPLDAEQAERHELIRKKLDKLNALGKLRHYTKHNCSQCKGLGGFHFTPPRQPRRYRYCRCIDINLIEALDMEQI